MTFELFIPVYNEAYLLPYTIEWYRKKVGAENLTINIYDNGSDDGTAELAKSLGCNVGVFETFGQVRDDLLTKFKDTIWKGSQADFVIVCDCDEWVDINPTALEGKTVLKTIGYNMIGVEGETPDQITDGIRADWMDKILVFSPSQITDIGYSAGAHWATPTGNVIWAEPVNMYHLKFLTADYLVAKYASSRDRLSAINKQYKWGSHYEQEEGSIRNMYQLCVEAKFKVKDI